MKAKVVIAATIFVASLFCAAMYSEAKEIRVITDRTESHLKPLFKYYEKTTGTKVNAVYIKKGLIPRLEARPTEADVVITKTANILEVAKKKGLLQPFKSSRLMADVPIEFRDDNNFHLSISYRGRVIYYSKERVRPEELSTYEDLVLEKWKGKICIRSGYHNYNLSLFSQLANTIGMDKTRAFLKGLKSNLARAPKGNDRAQVRAVYEGQCDLAIANSYYMGIMLSRDDQRDWALAANEFFPNQNSGGTFILRSGAALTTAKENTGDATRFLEFLVGDYAQNYMSNAIFAYSVNGRGQMPEINRKLGAEQKEVRDGKFKINFIPLDKVESLRTEIVNILNEINFDNK